MFSDFNKTISRDYGVLIEEAGIALRGLFLIDPEGVLRQMSVNDLPVGRRSIDEQNVRFRVFTEHRNIQRNKLSAKNVSTLIGQMARVQICDSPKKI